MKTLDEAYTEIDAAIDKLTPEQIDTVVKHIIKLTHIHHCPRCGRAGLFRSQKGLVTSYECVDPTCKCRWKE